MKILQLYMVVLLISCGEQKQALNCPDKLFRENFENCINIIKSKQAGKEINLNSLGSAYSCLAHITKVKTTSIIDGDMPYLYPAPNQQLLLNQDVANWYQWYFENEFKIRESDVDSLFKSISKEKNVLIKWPPKFSN